MKEIYNENYYRSCSTLRSLLLLAVMIKFIYRTAAQLKTEEGFQYV